MRRWGGSPKVLKFIRISCVIDWSLSMSFLQFLLRSSGVDSIKDHVRTLFLTSSKITKNQGIFLMARVSKQLLIPVLTKI